MTRHLTIILLLFTFPTFGQNSYCFCDKNTLMNEATVSCDKTTFSNNTKLYWQYNCDSIWLTLENINGQKKLIDQVPVELYGYTYRLGFHLIKEFDKTILFRSSCSANGPCLYTLIDKNNGEKLDEFGQLICIDTDVQWENAHQYNFDFVVYISSEQNLLVIYYIDNGKTIKIPFNENLASVIPEHSFEKMTLENNILTLNYEIYEFDRNIKKTLKVDVNNKKFIH